MVPQVTVIGILMIVNGALCVLYGLLLIFVGPLMLSFMNFQGAPPQAQPQIQQAQQMFQIVSIVYIVLGAVVAIAGCMNIAGGIAAVKFRSRTFVITALFFNIVPTFTCYCTLTSLGLMIWGLIVMFQGDVAHAFSLGASGYTADEIKRRMAEREYRRYRDDDYDDSRRDNEDRPRTRRPAEDEPAPPRKPPVPPGTADDDRIQEI
ncbi:MAG: hypothetical protein L0Y71_22200 [Gemmataceae bacterium]|nr:hypothetical protein [Gemmataceae bacterium]